MENISDWRLAMEIDYIELMKQVEAQTPAEKAKSRLSKILKSDRTDIQAQQASENSRKLPR